MNALIPWASGGGAWLASHTVPAPCLGTQGLCVPRLSCLQAQGELGCPSHPHLPGGGAQRFCSSLLLLALCLVLF